MPRVLYIVGSIMVGGIRGKSWRSCDLITSLFWGNRVTRPWIAELWLLCGPDGPYFVDHNPEHHQWSEGPVEQIGGMCLWERDIWTCGLRTLRGFWLSRLKIENLKSPRGCIKCMFDVRCQGEKINIHWMRILFRKPSLTWFMAFLRKPQQLRVRRGWENRMMMTAILTYYSSLNQWVVLWRRVGRQKT